MSTEQELAAVAEAITKRKQSGDGADALDLAAVAIAAVNTVRAEQASAGDREAVDNLEQAVGDKYLDVLGWLERIESARAAVLARMQRPVIAVTDAMVERFYRAFYDILVTSGWDKSDEFARIRVGIEAALREDGEA